MKTTIAKLVIYLIIIWILYMHVNLFLSQEEYVAEGLQWSFVKYQDNQGCLDLIEGCPVGVFALLNEVLSQLFVLLFL